MNKEDVRILVVDDHALTRDMVRMILKGLGFSEIITAENGEVAYDRLNEASFDLVICDWNMPRCTGLEFLAQVRSEERYKDLPFLMLTAETYRESVRAAMEAGVNDYIGKPFTAAVLGQKVIKVLGL